VRARAPASSANLGPGFDVLAIALECYIHVDVTPAASLEVHSSGEGAHLSSDASHLAAKVVTEVLGHDRFSLTVHSEIPVSRGLGSSAALAAAAAAAAGAHDPLAIAAAYDGHPENAAASVMGGLVAATKVGDSIQATHLALDDALAFVAVIPGRALATAEARSVLADSVPRADAIFNLGRMGLLVGGLADHTSLTAAATGDRLHQDARSALFPEAPELLSALIEAGSLASCWSGAGPTLLGIALADVAGDVARTMEAVCTNLGLEAQVLAMKADHRGLVYGQEADFPA